MVVGCFLCQIEGSPLLITVANELCHNTGFDIGIFGIRIIDTGEDQASH